MTSASAKSSNFGWKTSCRIRCVALVGAGGVEQINFTGQIRKMDKHCFFPVPAALPGLATFVPRCVVDFLLSVLTVLSCLIESDPFPTHRRTETIVSGWELSAGAVAANTNKKHRASWFQLNERWRRPLDEFSRIDLKVSPDSEYGRCRAFKGK